MVKRKVTDIFQLSISVGYLAFADRQNEKALSGSQRGPSPERTPWRNEEFPGLEVFNIATDNLEGCLRSRAGWGEVGGGGGWER